MGCSCQCRGSSVSFLKTKMKCCRSRMSVKVGVMYWHCEGLNLNSILGYRYNVDNINSHNFVSTCLVFSNKNYIHIVRLLTLEEESCVGGNCPSGK